jgi:hypothetical protein
MQRIGPDAHGRRNLIICWSAIRLHLRVTPAAQEISDQLPLFTVWHNDAQLRDFMHDAMFGNLET